MRTLTAAVCAALLLAGCGGSYDDPVELAAAAGDEDCLLEPEATADDTARCEHVSGRIVAQVGLENPALVLAIGADRGDFRPTVVGADWTVSAPDALTARRMHERVGGELLIDVCDFQRWAELPESDC